MDLNKTCKRHVIIVRISNKNWQNRKIALMSSIKKWLISSWTTIKKSPIRKFQNLPKRSHKPKKDPKLSSKWWTAKYKISQTISSPSLALRHIFNIQLSSRLSMKYLLDQLLFFHSFSLKPMELLSLVLPPLSSSSTELFQLTKSIQFNASRWTAQFSWELQTSIKHKKWEIPFITNQYLLSPKMAVFIWRKMGIVGLCRVDKY